MLTEIARELFGGFYFGANCFPPLLLRSAELTLISWSDLASELKIFSIFCFEICIRLPIFVAHCFSFCLSLSVSLTLLSSFSPSLSLSHALSVFDLPLARSVCLSLFLSFSCFLMSLSLPVFAKTGWHALFSMKKTEFPFFEFPIFGYKTPSCNFTPFMPPSAHVSEPAETGNNSVGRRILWKRISKNKACVFLTQRQQRRLSYSLMEEAEVFDSRKLQPRPFCVNFRFQCFRFDRSGSRYAKRINPDIFGVVCGACTTVKHSNFCWTDIDTDIPHNYRWATINANMFKSKRELKIWTVLNPILISTVLFCTLVEIEIYPKSILLF